jgi:lysophospholipase L1-like esterase
MGLPPGSGDGLFGLGGISVSTSQVGQFVYLDADCDLLEIHYLQQPNGGGLELYDNRQLMAEFSTEGELTAQVRRFGTQPGTHHFVLKTASARPIRVFGWVAEKRRGVTYESLGINGARASVLLHWDERMLATYLERRDPALIVLAYGTNDAVGFDSGIDRYQEMFSTILRRLRRMAPNAAILVIGPPDAFPRPRGRFRPPADLERVISAQQAAAHENGCAFWDLRERMGGVGSMREWERAGLAQRDYVHFTPAGYHQLADALFADLMLCYTSYEKVRLRLLGRAKLP